MTVYTKAYFCKVTFILEYLLNLRNNFVDFEKNETKLDIAKRDCALDNPI